MDLNRGGTEEGGGDISGEKPPSGMCGAGTESAVGGVAWPCGDGEKQRVHTGG